MSDFFPTRQAEPFEISADPLAIAAAEAVKARIQSAYVMAFRKPRNELEARSRILSACKRPEFAERAEYKIKIGSKTAKGPTIRFAELALREWGNILTETQLLYEDANTRRVRVSVLDLETNAQFSKDVSIQKSVERRSKKGREDDVISERKNSYGETVFILRATEEELYTKEAAWVSKIIRNEGLRIIPTDIIQEGMGVARKTTEDRAAQDPMGEKKRLADAFSNINVPPRELEKYLGHTLDTISPAEIANLRIVYQSIADGETTWHDISGSEEVPAKSEKDSHDPEAVERFDNRIADQPVVDIGKLTRYLGEIAEKQGLEIADIKTMAIEAFPAFWAAYQKWLGNTHQTPGEHDGPSAQTPYDPPPKEPDANHGAAAPGPPTEVDDEMDKRSVDDFCNALEELSDEEKADAVKIAGYSKMPRNAKTRANMMRKYLQHKEDQRI